MGGKMARKIFRTGNSAVVSLPTDVLETVGLNPGDEVTVTADPERRWIVVAPAQEALPGVRPDFLDRVDRFIERYQPALKTLAKE
jgi:putative addiction module antidote